MPSAGAPFPVPGPGLHADAVKWKKGRRIERIHDEKYASTQFNTKSAGNSRFSSIAAKGKIIPTLYGGSTFECVAMETVFRDIPYSRGFKSFDKKKLQGKQASIIIPTRDLQLINLANTALRKLVITRNQLIDNDAADYANTRPWAVALHEQFPLVDGLVWVSRQDDEAHAVVLFGDRVKNTDLEEVDPPVEITVDPVIYARLLDLAQRIGVNII